MAVISKKFSLPRPDGSRTQPLILLKKADAWLCPRSLLVAALAGGSDGAVTALRDGAKGREGAVVEASPDELKVLRDMGGLGGSASKAALVEMAWGCGVLGKLPGADAGLLALALGQASFVGISPIPSELPSAPETDDDVTSDGEDDALDVLGAGGAVVCPGYIFFFGVSCFILFRAPCTSRRWPRARSESPRPSTQP